MKRPLPLARAERFRPSRAVPTRDWSIGAQIDRERAAALSVARSAERVWGAWASVVPAELREMAEAVTFARGVLTIRVRDSATRFALDRFLRAGGQRALAARASAAIKRVRLVT